MKDALGHGSNKWSPYGASKVAKMYVSLNGRKDALVRTEPHISGANKGQYLWQHGNEVGHAGSVDSAKRAVEDRQAASQLASGPKSDAAPVHDSMGAALRAFSDKTAVMNANNSNGYFGRALSKTGRAIGTTGPHPDHDAAANAAFAAHPKANTVSTSRGQYGMDIRFHSRNR